MNDVHFAATPGTVYFVGAGPGAPDLITLRGRDVIEQADLIVYADSLVQESMSGFAHKPGVRVVGSSGLHLDQIIDLMADGAAANGVVARLHTGDPALYGATHEQMIRLDQLGIPYEVVPGVPAVFAAAARLKVELTVPEVVQTIILTRIAGRTPMPDGEDLRALAAHGASLIIHLSVREIRAVVAELLSSGGYETSTPVTVLHKVSWPDESVVAGTLADIAAKVEAAGYTRHALIVVSPALDATLRGSGAHASRLYDKTFTHGRRDASSQ